MTFGGEINGGDDVYVHPQQLTNLKYYRTGLNKRLTKTVSRSRLSLLAVLFVLRTSTRRRRTLLIREPVTQNTT